MERHSIAREMLHRHSLDDDSAARLLQGTVHPDDAPPGFASVADLLATAAALPAVDDEAGNPTISAMVEAIRASAPISDNPRRRSMIGKLFAGKAVVAFAIVGLTASGAAAATGSLPDPVQSVVSDAVGHVGVDIPHPNHGKSAGHRQDGEHRQDGKTDAPDATPGADDAGNNGQQTSDAAHDAKTGAKESGDKVGPAVCTAVGSKCQAGQQGSGDDATPPTTAGSEDPNQGQSGEDHGQGGATTPTTNEHATTPTTGGITTGEDNSGRELPASDNGKGKGKGKGRSGDSDG